MFVLAAGIKLTTQNSNPLMVQIYSALPPDISHRDNFKFHITHIGIAPVRATSIPFYAIKHSTHSQTRKQSHVLFRVIYKIIE